MQDKQHIPETAADLIGGTLESMSALESSPGDSGLLNQLNANLGLIADISARNDPIGVEMKGFESQLRGYMDWYSGGREGDPPYSHNGVYHQEGDVLGMGGEYKLATGATSRKKFLSFRESAVDGKYLVSPTLEGYYLENGDPETTRMAALLGTDGRQQQAKWENGSASVQTGDGVWEDLGAEMSYVADNWDGFRDGMRGVMPHAGGVIGEFFAGHQTAATVAGMATRGVIAGLDPDREYGDTAPFHDVGTADATLRFAALPDLGDPDHSYQRLQDPLLIRAFHEVNSIVSSGQSQEVFGKELRPIEDATIGETAIGAAAFMSDFWLAGRAVGPLLKGGGQALALATNNPVAKLLLQNPVKTTGKIVLGTGSKPLNSAFNIGGGLTTTAASFALYETAAQALAGNESAPEAAFEGMKQGMFLWGMSSIISAGGAAGMRWLTRLDKKTMDAINPRIRTMARRPELLSRQGDPGTDELVETVVRASKNMSGSDSTKAILTKLGAEGHMVGYAGKMLDSMALGAALGAHGNAMADPEFEGMTGAQKIARMVAGFSSEEAIGSALGFAMGVATRGVAHGMHWGREWQRAPKEVQEALASKVIQVSQQIAAPNRVQDVADFQRAFEKLGLNKEYGPFRTHDEVAAEVEALRPIDPIGKVGPIQGPPGATKPGKKAGSKPLAVPGRYRHETKRLIHQHFGPAFEKSGKFETPEEAARATERYVDVLMAFGDSHARRWAEENGKDPLEWWPAHIGDIKGEAAAAQITKEALKQTEAQARQTSTEEFGKFFGDPVEGSKVVRWDGKPLPVHHWSRSPEGFGKFHRYSHFGTAEASRDRRRVFIGSGINAEVSPGERSYQVYLNIRNPLDVTDAQASNALILHEFLTGNAKTGIDPLTSQPSKALIEGYKDFRKSMGQSKPRNYSDPLPFDFLRVRTDYDGLRYYNAVEDKGSVSWVIFKGAQAKALNNRGTWDSRKADILYQGKAKGAVDFLQSGQAMIYALQGADSSTVFHEFAHVWRRSGLWVSELKEIEKWAGVKNGKWSRAAEEKFARGVERYLREGVSPVKRLDKPFAAVAKYMGEVYSSLKGSPVNVRISDPIRAHLDQLFMGRKELREKDVLLKLANDYTTPAKIAAVFNAHRNEPEFLGMDEMELIGHVLRNDLPKIMQPTTATLMAQAGENTVHVMEIARANGIMEMEVGPVVSAEGTKLMVELANGGNAELLERYARKGREDLYRESILLAQEARQQARQSVRLLARQHVSPEQAEVLGAIFKYLDNHKVRARKDGEATPMPVDAVGAKVLKKHNLIDENGYLKTGVLQSMEVLMQELRNVSHKSVAVNYEGPLMHNVSPWLTFDRAPHEHRESWAAKYVKAKVVMDMAQRRIPPYVLRHLKRLGAYTGGPWGGLNFLKSIEAEAMKLASGQVLTRLDADTRRATVLTQSILSRMMAHWGYRHPPRAHLELLEQVVSSGAFKSFKGPEDFEKRLPGSGYLFEAAKNQVDLMREMGHELHLLGYLDKRQLQKWDGQYVAHYYVKDEVDSLTEELRDGRFPGGFAGRNLSRRSNGEDETEVRLNDPFWYLPQQVAQESKVREWLGTLSGLVYGGHAIKERDYRNLNPTDQTFYMDMVLDGHLPGVTKGGNNRRAIVLGTLLARQAESYAKEEGAAGREMPPQMRQLYNKLLHPKDGEKLYIPRQLAQELDALAGQLFNPPLMKSPADRFFYGYDLATRYVRRGLTMLRPKHWTLNITNSVMTNHLMGTVSFWDFTRSIITGKGHYADSARDLLKYQELSAETGAIPSKKPDDMTMEAWDRLTVLKGVLERLSGGTFLHAGIEGETVTDIFTSLSVPDNVAKNVVEDIKASGNTLESKEAMIGSVFNASSRLLGTGLGRVDRAIGKLAGGKPEERARAIANHVATYQAVEMFFKHAAVLRTLEKNPGMTLDQAVNFGAGGTADYRNTSSALRAANTAYGTYRNKLWSSADTQFGRARQAIMRDTLKGQFWMYQQNMIFPKLRSTVIHPLRAASVAAIMSGVATQLWKFATDDPDEDRSYNEGVYGGMYTAGSRPELLDDATLEAYKRLGAPTWWPDAIGGQRFATARFKAAKAWNSVLAGKPFLFKSPYKNARESMSSMRDLAPGVGDWLGVGQTVSHLFSPDKTPDEKAREFMDTLMFRTMEMSMGTGMALVEGLSPRAGDTRSGSVLRNVQKAIGFAFPTISPMYQLSKDGIAAEESLSLDGQKVADWVRGIRSGREPRGPLEAVGELAFSTMWRNSSIRQKRGVGAERSTMAALLQEIVPNVDAGQGEFYDTYTRAQRGVHAQLMQIVGDTYGEWTDKMTGVMTLDAALARQLYGENTPMEKYIASQDHEEFDPLMGTTAISDRDAATTYWENFRGSSYWLEALDLISLAGRRRQMEPGMFQEAIGRMLKDPGGSQLQNWIYEKLRTPGTAQSRNVPQLASLFQYAVAIPKEGQRRTQWNQIAAIFRANGYYPIDAPAEWSASEAARSLGIKPETGGGGMLLRDSLLRREPTRKRPYSPLFDKPR